MNAELHAVMRRAMEAQGRLTAQEIEAALGADERALREVLPEVELEPEVVELPLPDGLPPPLMTVTEMRDAYRVGIKRYHAARDRGAQNRWAWLPNAAQRADTDGCAAVAEALVSRALERKWLSPGSVPDDPNKGDIDGGVSVRWTPRSAGSLIVHEDEKAHLYAVLVVHLTFGSWAG